jgi:phosphate transport system protein
MPVRENELRALKETILKMASLVEAAIRDSIKSLMDRNEALAEKVIKNDHIINSFDVRIDEECIRLLALKQPMGKDLRFITTGMKITSDLERIADHAVNISERAIELKNEPFLRHYEEIPRMREIAQAMVRDAIDAFVREDTRLAKDVIMRDDEVDDLRSYLLKDLVSLMIQNPETVTHATRLSYIPRNLERIADHATNIAEMVIYMVEGRIIRHVADISDIDGGA